MDTKASGCHHSQKNPLFPSLAIGYYTRYWLTLDVCFNFDFDIKASTEHRHSILIERLGTSGQGFKEIKCFHKRNSFVKLKMGNCQSSNVKKNYKEKTFTLRDLVVDWY